MEWARTIDSKRDCSSSSQGDGGSKRNGHGPAPYDTGEMSIHDCDNDPNSTCLPVKMYWHRIYEMDI